VIAVAIHTYAPAISLNTAYLIVVTYSVVFVLGSIQRWLDMFNGVLLPFNVIGLVTAVATAISCYGLNDHWLKLGPAGGAFSLAGVWYSFTYFIGVWTVFMYTFDYARFGKLQDSAYHANIDFGWPFYIVTFLVNGSARHFSGWHGANSGWPLGNLRSFSPVEAHGNLRTIFCVSDADADQHDELLPCHD
jgi:cytosine permease